METCHFDYYDQYKQSLNSELGSHKAYGKATRKPCSYSRVPNKSAGTLISTVENFPTGTLI